MATKLEELVKKFNSEHEGTILVTGSITYNIERIPFSSPRANYMTYGGIPLGRVIEFAGEENGGKTTTALDIVSNAQKYFQQEWEEEVERLEADKTSAFCLFQIYDLFPFFHSISDLSFDRLTYIRNLEKRKEEVTNSIEEQGKMTEELAEAISKAITLAEVEDIYRPYKQKRKTRASVAKEKGLEPLADLLFGFTLKGVDLNDIAKDYVDAEKGVETVEDALQGASDIIAEIISVFI